MAHEAHGEISLFTLSSARQLPSALFHRNASDYTSRRVILIHSDSQFSVLGGPAVKKSAFGADSILLRERDTGGANVCLEPERTNDSQQAIATPCGGAK